MDAGSLTAPKAKVDAVQSSAGVQDRSHVLAVAGVHARVLLSAIIILRRDPIGNLFRPPSVYYGHLQEKGDKRSHLSPFSCYL